MQVLVRVRKAKRKIVSQRIFVRPFPPLLVFDLFMYFQSVDVIAFQRDIVCLDC